MLEFGVLRELYLFYLASKEMSPNICQWRTCITSTDDSGLFGGKFKKTQEFSDTLNRNFLKSKINQQKYKSIYFKNKKVGREKKNCGKRSEKQ